MPFALLQPWRRVLGALVGASLRLLPKDSSTDVRITAAQALGQSGTEADLKEILPLLGKHADWKKQNVFSALAALNSLDAPGVKAAPLTAFFKTAPTNGLSPNARYNSCLARLVESLKAKFKP